MDKMIDEAVDKHRAETLQEFFKGMTHEMFLTIFDNFPEYDLRQQTMDKFPILLPNAKTELLQFVRENVESVKNTRSSVQAAIKNLKWYRDPVRRNIMLRAFQDAARNQLGMRIDIRLDSNEYDHGTYASFLGFTKILYEQEAEQRCLKNREAKDEQRAGKVPRKTRLSKKPY